jgi:hypothetical protein
VASARRVARSALVVLLVVLGALCMTVSPVAIWSRNILLNTDRYVETVKPLAQDVGVQDAVIASVDRQIQSHVDLRSLTGQVLPPAVAGLIAAPLQNAAAGLVNSVVTAFVRSDAFVAIWVQINRLAHEQLVYDLTASPGSRNGSSPSGPVILDLAPIVTDVKAQLIARGLTIAVDIPVLGATLQIAQLSGIRNARAAVRLLDSAATWLPWLGLGLILGAVLTANRRRFVLAVSLLGVAGGMMLVGLALLIGRNYYLDAVSGDVLSRSTAGQMFDTVVRFLRDGLRVICIAALLLALLAWLLGPTPGAVGTRDWIRSAITTAGTAIDASRVTQVARRHRAALRILAVGIGALAVLFWNSPTTAVVLAIAAVVALAWGLIEVLRSGAPHDRMTS